MIEVVLALVFCGGFVGGIWWLAGKCVNDREPSMSELLRQAGVVCPYCGRRPLNISRSSLNPRRAMLDCSLLHTWIVHDDEWMPAKDDGLVESEAG